LNLATNKGNEIKEWLHKVQKKKILIGSGGRKGKEVNGGA